MFKTSKNIAHYVMSIFSHVVTVGENENKDALPFLTTIAAIIYVLSATLGSGSYEEMYKGFGIIPRFIIICVLIMSILIFGSCLLSYIFSTLNFESFKEQSKRSHHYLTINMLLFLSAISIAIAAAIGLHSLSTETISSINEKTKVTIIYFLVIVPVVLSLSSMVEIVLTKATISFVIFDFLIIFCVISISYNIYRDSYKNSLNSNSQFCFWTNNKFSSGPPSVFNAVDTEDYYLCNSLQDANIDFKSLFNGVANNK